MKLRLTCEDTFVPGVIFGLLTSGVVWLIGSDRTQAVAGFDGGAPRWMGYFSKRLGTPIGVNLLSGRQILLCPPELEALTWQDHGLFSQLLGTPGDPAGAPDVIADGRPTEAG